MGNRTLTRADDARTEILEDGEPHRVGMWEEVRIERSASGQPGILVIITRYENDQEYDQMCVSVPDGDTFLAPVIDWLRSAERTYRVGDPDTTPSYGGYCDAKDGQNFTCTRRPGHSGEHAAGTGTEIAAVWED